MPRTTKRLTHKGALALRSPGMHADGDGLYLRIDQAGGRSWVLIYHFRGRRREMGLGPAAIGLGQARTLADAARAQVREGLDPIAVRRAARSPSGGEKFSQVASDLLDELEKGWKSSKQRPQWEASLKQHAPAVWKADVAVINTEAVLSALRPIWTTLPETARRIRGRIERVLDAAKVRDLRSGENPARWSGHLEHLLADNTAAKAHFAAMPYAEVPDFVALLRTRDSVSALACRWAILTAARSGEVRGAHWDEITSNAWVIPASRMKAKKEHRIPLTEPMQALLDTIPKEARGGLIFPGMTGKPLTDAGLSKVLRVNGVPTATVHGFRSSFRDWAGDCTTFPRDLIEEALAHIVGNAVERAYRRSDALEKRRSLMKAWNAYCTGERGQIIQMQDRA